VYYISSPSHNIVVGSLQVDLILFAYISNLSESDSAGLRRSNLISWYLGEMESEIESEAELIEKKSVVEKVLDRLVHHVSNVK
jgi:hypothetical protein